MFDSNVPDDFRTEERVEFEAFLDDLPGPYLVCEDEVGRIVACGGYAREADGVSVALCWGMVVRDRQGEGLGQRMLETRLEQAREDPSICRVVLTTSHRVREFFEKMGFAAREVVQDGIAPGLHRVDMTLDVDGTTDPDWSIRRGGGGMRHPARTRVLVAIGVAALMLLLCAGTPPAG